ncbi:hypothetical protein D3C87_1477540 [compost metagenome]
MAASGHSRYWQSSKPSDRPLQPIAASAWRFSSTRSRMAAAASAKPQARSHFVSMPGLSGRPVYTVTTVLPGQRDNTLPQLNTASSRCGETTIRGKCWLNGQDAGWDTARRDSKLSAMESRIFRLDQDAFQQVTYPERATLPARFFRLYHPRQRSLSPSRIPCPTLPSCPTTNRASPSVICTFPLWGWVPRQVASKRCGISFPIHPTTR